MHQEKINNHVKVLVRRFLFVCISYFQEDIGPNIRLTEQEVLDQKQKQPDITKEQQLYFN